MIDETSVQRELTKVALEALAGHAFALAGSGALREHGVVSRLTHDADLFTNDLDAAAFDAAVEQLLEHLTELGYVPDQVRRSPHFAQLRIATPDGRTVDVDAIRQSGRFTDAALLEAAAERDAGFDLGMFAGQLQQVHRITADRFFEYGLPATEVAAMKQRLTDWATVISSPTASHREEEAE